MLKVGLVGMIGAVVILALIPAVGKVILHEVHTETRRF